MLTIEVEVHFGLAHGVTRLRRGGRSCLDAVQVDFQGRIEVDAVGAVLVKEIRV